jgi:hypothetical protein
MPGTRSERKSKKSNELRRLTVQEDSRVSARVSH